jgi:hypothetical protein
MKQIKLTALIAIFALCASFARAQTTPETIIMHCPDHLTAWDLALLDVYPAEGTLTEKVLDAQNSKDTFYEKIRLLHEIRKDIEKKDDANAEVAAKKDADRLVRQQTGGHSIEQVQNMSDAERMKMANGMVSEKLGAMGLGNMSLGDLQALEGKSDEEIMKAMSGIVPAQIGAQTNKQADNAVAQVAAQAELKKIQDKWAEIDRLCNQDIANAQTQLKAIYEKYRVALKEKSVILLPFQDGKVDQELFDNGYKAALGNYRAVMYDYLVACYEDWDETLAVVKARIRSKLADVPRFDELMAKNMSLNGMTATSRTLSSTGYDIAAEYLNAAASIISPPLPELNIGDTIKDK